MLNTPVTPRCRMRDRFKQLLAETGYVTAGKRLDEVRVLFMGRESFDSLTEHDRQIIYDQHQKEITERARANYMVRCPCLLYFPTMLSLQSVIC